MSGKTLVAARTDTPIQVDGVLDEGAWAAASPATGFLQSDPYEGREPSERTEIRVLFDDANIYFGIYCYTNDPEKIIVTDLRRDFSPRDADSIEIILDTFHDERSGFLFVTNPQGAKLDAQLANDGRDINEDWDGVWQVRSKVNGDGWISELAIPFETLRFPKTGAGTWGINFLRRIRYKNEIDSWVMIPRRYLAATSTQQNVYRVSFSGDLTGLEGMRQGRNLKVKPFAVASVTKFAEDESVGGDADAGVDIKYGVSSGLTLDLTVNTDFSQVEADEEQINLTRFALFFPEKREFFLENSGIFQFGDIPQEWGQNRSQEAQIFFSRRIGLSESREPIPILSGARLSGRAGAYNLGFLNVQTRKGGDQPGENFTVFRMRRDLFTSSDVGVIFTNRQSSVEGDHNRVVGVDSNWRFFRNLTVNSFLAKSETPELKGDDTAWKASATWRDDFLQLASLYTDLGENFNPETGFVRRSGIRKARNRVEMRPRLEGNSLIRAFRPHARSHYITDRDNRLITRSNHFAFDIFFQDGSRIEMGRNEEFERLVEPFEIQPSIAIPVGDYSFDNWFVLAQSDGSQTVSGSVRFNKGTFFNGNRRNLGLGGTFRPDYKFSLGLNYSRNQIELPNGSFTTNLSLLSIDYAFSTRMFLNALIQYNNDTGRVSSNIRFNLIHRPLSDLFIVFNEQREVTQQRDLDRGLFIKYTHMFEF